MDRFGKQSAAAQRAADRRERENAAPRLAAEIPDLVSLKLEVEEKSEVAAINQPKYIRRVVVANAPALFLIPCGDSSCLGGGHDVTSTVMQALRQRKTAFSGSESCSGSLGTGNCSRVMHFDGMAEYR